MKTNLTPITKKIITVYAVVIGILLLSAIYLRIKIQLFELSGWNAFVFNKSYLIVLPLAAIITFVLSKKITLSSPQQNGANKGKAILVVIMFVINGMLLLSIVHNGAKLYNMYGPKQTQITVKGTIVKVFTKNRIKKRNNKKQFVTIYDQAQQRQIKLESRKIYAINSEFNDTLTKGSLGFLYK